MSIQEYTVWPVVKLSLTLNTLENGSRPPGGVGHIKQGVPSIGGEHLTASGEFDFQNTRFISKDYFAKLNRGVIQKYDVLVVKDGATTGKTAFVDDDFPFDRAAINEHVYILRPDASLVLPRFLFFFLYSDWGQLQIQREFQGAAIGGINQGFIQRLEIPLPPLLEQARIVAILRQADELRRLHQLARARINDLYGEMYYQLFGDGRPSAKHKKTDKLQNLLKVPLTSGYSPPSNSEPEGIPVFNLSAITDYGLDETQLKFLPAENYQGKGDDLEIGDLLISRSNTQELVGRVARYKGKPRVVIYPDTTIRVRLRNIVDSIYVENYLRSDFMRAVIKRLARGTSGSMKKISQTDINDFDVLWPPQEERALFAKFCFEFDELQNIQEDRTVRVEALFNSLLSQAFSGELTAVYRTQHQAELQEAAAQRDIALSLRNHEPPPIDFEAVHVTAEEEGQFRQSVQQIFKPAMQDLLTSLGTSNTSETLARQMNFSAFADMIRSALPTYNNLVSDILADNLAAIGEGMRLALAEHFTDTRAEHFTGTMAAAIAPLAESIPLPSETFYQSLSQSILALAAQARQIVQEPPQPTRAIHAQLDPTVKTTLQAIQALSTYFTPAELHQLLQELGHHFGQNRATDLVQVEAGLQLLEAAGFVRQVLISERLVYRLIDPVADGALLPTELAG